MFKNVINILLKYKALPCCLSYMYVYSTLISKDEMKFENVNVYIIGSSYVRRVFYMILRGFDWYMDFGGSINLMHLS